MAVEFSEYEAPADDTRMEVLEQLMGGKPWVAIRVTETGEDESGEFTFSIGMECGGGITDSQTIRSLLEKTLVALP